ncbi:MAG: Modification methylase DpnIIA [Verrucomicrobia subdivision 3 bacterium]|nr:Modification methylase DpnIIA [Limisphaerales bacterium]MCS1417729.1 Modification methylase DpnIIA [Limisphaerales bacterium]
MPLLGGQLRQPRQVLTIDRIYQAHLSDVNLELMLTYKMLHQKPEAVIRLLKVHERKHNRQYYSRVRDKHHTEQDPAALAARFIYLNKTCFNGLYRVNKAGKFNVPIGRHNKVTICDEKNLMAVSSVLDKATLRMSQFDKITPAEGDLVYCDPPYDGTFTGYTGAGFGEADQKRLQATCEKWRQAGVHVIVSNNDTPLIRRLYSKWNLHEVHAPRNINCNGNGRGKVAELLISG